jgi:hypothetical protein
MIRIGSLLAIVAAVIIVFQSCDKKKEDCPFLSPKMVYVNFTDPESDTLIFRRFEKNSLFTNPIDTFLLSKGNMTRTVIGTDSIVLSTTIYPKFYNEFYNNDWEIILPGVKTFRFSEITPLFTSEREASAECQSFVSSLKLDGVKDTFTTWFGSGYQVYLNK